MVNIVDDHNGKYKIALNSAIQFGIIFDPNNNLVEALVRSIKYMRHSVNVPCQICVA